MAAHNVYTLSDTTATRISELPAVMSAGRDFTVQNLGTGAVYLGSNANTTSASFGFRLDPAAGWSVELNGQDSIWAIAENDGDSVAVMSLGLEVIP